MVDKFSARHSHPIDIERHSWAGLKKNYSGLVKFSEGDNNYDIVLSRLKSMTAAVRKIPRGIDEQQRPKNKFEHENPIF